MINIRRASRDEALYISLLGRVTFTETFGHLFGDNLNLLDYLDQTFSVEKIENSLQKTDNMFWIAFADRLPVGYAKLKLNSTVEFLPTTNVCQLQKIYVLKDFLSMKIGHELQSQLIKKATELKFEKVWLSVLANNERAIGFYQKSGFEEVGKHVFKIGKERFDFIAMSKSIN